MFRKLFSFFDRNAYRREVEQYMPVIERIQALEARCRAWSDAELRQATGRLRGRLQAGERLEVLLPEAFAAVREAARRAIGLRPYDVQMIGGIVLASGAIAEMRTGEGKTLVAVAPLYLNALSGRGAHLVTVNDYLARRDARWMGPVFHALGMSVGVLQSDEPDPEAGVHRRLGYLFDPQYPSGEERFHHLCQVGRAAAYAADVTYGSNSEFGFDYLRDNLVAGREDKAQRGHVFAIVDEVDNILIDEARTPLIISGENRSELEWYVRMAEVARRLTPREVEINRRDQFVTLTPGGEKHVAALLGRPLADPRRPEEASLEQRHLIGHLEQALRARFLYERDRQYIIQDGQVVIVDEFTGRMMPGRRWTDGLHQAVEAKEGLEVQSESMTYATISLQNYFRLYKRLSGMTGTGLAAAREFEKIYKLTVHPIPTNVEYGALVKDAWLVERQERTADGLAQVVYARKNDPHGAALFWTRLDAPDELYLNAEAKRRAIVWEILRAHAAGRPLLVGTTSVADSEDLARMLSAAMLTRLAQTRLLRAAWLRRNPGHHPDLPVESLGFLNAPLGLIGPAKLEAAFTGLGLSADPLAELPGLLALLGLNAEQTGGLETALRQGIPHAVLNARYHYEESQIIAGGGALGSVIIATNMAGRGVDIKLGGELAEEVLAAVNRALDAAGTPQAYTLTHAERRAALQKLPPERLAGAEAEARFYLDYLDGMEKVRRLGGLYVLGGTRHESRRIDQQLRGRAARQGDPGGSRFFVSMEDELLARFGGLEAQAFLEDENRRGGDSLLPVPPEAGRRVIETAQNRVEGENFEIRKHLLEYDDVINAQRKAIYTQRDRILEKDDLSDDLAEMLAAELEAHAARSLEAEPPQAWQFIAWTERLQPSLARPVGNIYPSWPVDVVRRKALAAFPDDCAAGQLFPALLQIAERAFQAEWRFVAREIERQFDASLEMLHADAAGRMDAVDIALESLDPAQSARRPRQALKALSEAAGLEVRLSDAGLVAIKDNPRAAALEILDQVEAELLTASAAHLEAVLERLLGEAPQSSLSLPRPAQPGELLDRLQAAVQATFAARQARLFGADGRLAAALNTAQPLLAGMPAVARIPALLELLRAVSAGELPPSPANTASGADARLEQTAAPDAAEAGAPVVEQASPGEAQIRRPAPRLTYTFLAEELLDNVPSDEIVAQAQQHLLQAQAVMKADLGAAELNAAYRRLLLWSIDERWVDYLTRLEELRYEVRLEGMAHNDPLVMYKSMASGAYGTLLTELRRLAVAQMFTFLPAIRPDGAAEASALEKASPRLTYLKLG